MCLGCVYERPALCGPVSGCVGPVHTWAGLLNICNLGFVNLELTLSKIEASSKKK